MRAHCKIIFNIYNQIDVLCTSTNTISHLRQKNQEDIVPKGHGYHSKTTTITLVDVGLKQILDIVHMCL